MSERCARECIIQRAYRNFIYLPCTDPATNNSRFREDELGRSLPLDLMTVNHRQPFRLKLERDKVTSLHGDNIRPRILPPFPVMLPSNKNRKLDIRRRFIDLEPFRGGEGGDSRQFFRRDLHLHLYDFWSYSPPLFSFCPIFSFDSYHESDDKSPPNRPSTYVALIRRSEIREDRCRSWKRSMDSSNSSKTGRKMKARNRVRLTIVRIDTREMVFRAEQFEGVWDGSNS